MKKNGFTLIELMIIIAIIGILAAIAIPNFNRVREQSAIHAASSTIQSILKSLEAYASMDLEFVYPETVEGLLEVTASYLDITRVRETVEALGYQGIPSGRYTIAAKVRGTRNDTWAVYTDMMKSPRFVTTQPAVSSWMPL
jgi:prepilin-type N-terminal cleavage/methylation domain-containing protein